MTAQDAYLFSESIEKLGITGILSLIILGLIYFFYKEFRTMREEIKENHTTIKEIREQQKNWQEKIFETVMSILHDFKRGQR